MSEPVGLDTPRITVSLDDGRTLTARILNVDLLRWDRTAAKHGWPYFETVGVWHSTFIAWSALRREGQIPDDWTWEDFSETHCLKVQAAADEEHTNGDAPRDVVDPIRPEAARE